MSHIHNIAGQTDAAAQYQAYLERTRAARLEEDKDKVHRRFPKQAYGSQVDPDQDSEAEANANSEGEGEAESENEGDSSEGFGTHYA